LCLLILFALTLKSQDTVSFQELTRLFQYDQTVRLDIRNEEHSPQRCADHFIVVLGGHGVVSAFLVVPSLTGKHPAIVFAHDLSSKATSSWQRPFCWPGAPERSLSID